MRPLPVSMQMDWAKIDITTFSWQKSLGGAAHELIILSPRAIERWLHPTPLPDLSANQGRKLIEKFTRGETINTSMLAEDLRTALDWAEGLAVIGLDHRSGQVGSGC